MKTAIMIFSLISIDLTGQKSREFQQNLNRLQVISDTLIDKSRIGYKPTMAIRHFQVDSLGKKNGEARFYYEDGYLMIGQYLENEMHGIWNLYKCRWFDVRKILRHRYIYECGDLRSGVSYIRKKPQGAVHISFPKM